MSLSVLRNVNAADVRSKPFPHVIVHDALPEGVCDELIASYPDPTTFYGVDMTKNNLRYDYPAHRAIKDERIPALWRDMLAYHTSSAFYNDILRVFGDHITRLYYDRFRSLKTLAALRVGVRGDDNFDEKDLLMEAQISGNTPVREVSSVRGIHIDVGFKLFTGLLYLRPDYDDTQGGDLEIRRFKPGLSAKKKLRKIQVSQELSVAAEDTELVSTVRYRKNVLVLFINTIESLHAVTPRSPTPTPRMFMNLVAEVAEPLYLPIAQTASNNTLAQTLPYWRRAASRVKRDIRRVLGN